MLKYKRILINMPEKNSQTDYSNDVPRINCPFTGRMCLQRPIVISGCCGGGCDIATDFLTSWARACGKSGKFFITKSKDKKTLKHEYPNGYIFELSEGIPSSNLDKLSDNHHWNKYVFRQE